jgi:hypothetical protein
MAAVMPEDMADPAAGTDLYAAAALPDPEGTVTFYTVKKRFASFPSPAGMSLPNSPWAGIMTS